jgi:mRNA interferase RelE/StbE
MAYRVEVERVAAKAVGDLPVGEQRRITARLRRLEDDPRQGATKLTGAEGWRVRSGDYRVVFVIDDAQMVVTVTRIGQRRDVVRRL